MFVLIILTYKRNILENWFGWLWIIPIISILLGIILFYFVKIDDFEHPILYAITTISGLDMLVGGILAFIVNSIIYIAFVAKQNTNVISLIS